MFAARVSAWTRTFTEWAGSPYALALAVVGVLVWLVTGPYFRFSTGWNFAINSTTTVITFLLGFSIQHSQNRSERAIHLKLDELIRAVQGADDRLRGIECDEEEKT